VSALRMVVYPHLPGNATGKPFEKLAQRARMNPRVAGRLFADSYMELCAAAPLPVLVSAALSGPWAQLHSGAEDGSHGRRTAEVAAPKSPFDAGAPEAAPPLPPLHLVKVDVEGMELEALQGLAMGCGGLNRVHAVTAEVHDVGSRLQDTVALLGSTVGGFPPGRVVAVAHADALAAGLDNRHVYATREVGVLQRGQ
jgi:hypothetical protein